MRLNPLAASLLACALLLSPDALAIDGLPGGGLTYYEQTLGGNSTAGHESASADLPAAVNMSDANATLVYRSEVDEDGDLDWTIELRGLVRSHEQIDTLYQMVLALPVPDSAEDIDRAVWPREGDATQSVALIYGGEKVRLKRTRMLERMLLPSVVDASGSDKLPSLAGTGYTWALWDTIVAHDPDFGDVLQLLADVQYETAAGVAGPDPADARFKGFVITWLPSLDSQIPPFAIRIDVVAP